MAAHLIKTDVACPRGQQPWPAQVVRAWVSPGPRTSEWSVAEVSLGVLRGLACSFDLEHCHSPRQASPLVFCAWPPPQPPTHHTSHHAYLSAHHKHQQSRGKNLSQTPNAGWAVGTESDSKALGEKKERGGSRHASDPYLPPRSWSCRGAQLGWRNPKPTSSWGTRGPGGPIPLPSQALPSSPEPHPAGPCSWNDRTPHLAAGTKGDPHTANPEVLAGPQVPSTVQHSSSLHGPPTAVGANTAPGSKLKI